MEQRERQELALDIARRVRLLCVQEAPKELIDAMQDGSRQTCALYGVYNSAAWVEFEVRTGALHITFYLNNDQVLHLRLDAPSPALAELQRST